MAEMAKLNPGPGDEYHVFRWEDKLDTLLLSRLPCLLRNTTGDFDRRQAANEMVIEAKQNSKRFWKIATHGVARRLKQDASTIHQPDNVQSLEDDFWRKVDAAVTEALEHEPRRPTLDQLLFQFSAHDGQSLCSRASVTAASIRRQKSSSKLRMSSG